MTEIPLNFVVIIGFAVVMLAASTLAASSNHTSRYLQYNAYDQHTIDVREGNHVMFVIGMHRSGLLFDVFESYVVLV